MLAQLIYVSQAVRDMTEAELAEILAVAVRNNEKRHVTGLLLYSHGTFMQALEGDDATIDDLFRTIQADSRHRAVKALVRTSIRVREFSQWFMGFRAVREGDAVVLPNYAPFFEAGFDATRIAAVPGECIHLMKALNALPA